MKLKKKIKNLGCQLQIKMWKKSKRLIEPSVRHQNKIIRIIRTLRYNDVERKQITSVSSYFFFFLFRWLHFIDINPQDIFFSFFCVFNMILKITESKWKRNVSVLVDTNLFQTVSTIILMFPLQKLKKKKHISIYFI